MQKRILCAISACALAVTMMAGCANNTSPAASGDGSAPSDEASGASETSQKIVVAVGSNFKPYTYLDESDQPTGYDVAVLKAIDEKLPEYTFEFQAMDFKNILLSVESNKAQIGSQQFEINEERLNKYLFNKEPFAIFTSYVTVSVDNQEITGLSDLGGKSITIPTADNSETVINQYNLDNPDNPIEIRWVDYPSREEQVASLENGTWDATVTIPVVLKEMNDAFGGKVKAVGDPVTVTNSYFLFNKDQTELQEKVDQALKELKAEGTLTELSMEYLGVDITKE